MPGMTPEQELEVFLKTHPQCRNLTLDNARKWISQQSVDGAKCPCCSQFVKVYWRSINARQAVALIRLYKHVQPGTFAHVDAFGDPSNEISKLRYWGLIEEQPNISDPDKKRTGFWRMTPHGVKFVQHKVLIPKYAVLYLGEFKHLAEPLVSIHQVLGKKFSYHELMNTKG